MTKGFVGRKAELEQLGQLLSAVGQADQRGRAVLIRGRRRVGKSRLIEVFCERAAGIPWVFYTATLGEDAQHQRDELFRSIASESALPSRELAAETSPGSWDAAFRQLAALLPVDGPSIVVLDELPYLSVADPAFEGALQTSWDRHLSKLPVLLIGVGSDIAMMELLGSYGRPFHQRASEMVLHPLNPAEVGAMTDTNAGEAFDAYLITGGLPLLCRDWPAGTSVAGYLEGAFRNPTSALLVSGERSMASELPAGTNARLVLRAIGGLGERTFTAICQRTGLTAASVARSLDLLTEKRLVALDTPVSAKISKEKRYRVADPYLRFWLAIAADAIPRVERGRPDLAMRLFKQRWPSWRGRAIEPVIHEALNRLLPNDQWPAVEAVGSWWPRSNNPEVDLVGVGDPSRRVHFAGSIKWREKDAFGNTDLNVLARDALEVPGVDATTKLVAVSRAGIESKVDQLAQYWDPESLIAAWD